MGLAIADIWRRWKRHEGFAFGMRMRARKGFRQRNRINMWLPMKSPAPRTRAFLDVIVSALRRIGKEPMRYWSVAVWAEREKRGSAFACGYVRRPVSCRVICHRKAELLRK